MATYRKPRSSLGRALERISRVATQWTGTSSAFVLAVLVIVVWLLTGPLFHYSNTWQLVINTGTTIVTFVMVFLIQRSQNKESLTIQLKLNEIVAAMAGASNRLIDVEQLSEDELEIFHEHFHELAELTAKEGDLRKSHSIDEAHTRHDLKHAHVRQRAGDSKSPQSKV